MKLIFAFLLVSIFGVEAKGPSENRIKRLLGGQFVNVSSMPWNVVIYIVIIEMNMSAYCLGSIIGNFHILTAAHCACTERSIKILTYANNDTGGKIVVYEAESIIVHPNYPKNGCFLRNFDRRYDIAIIKTTKEIQFGDKVQAIKIRLMNIYHGFPVMKVGKSRTDSGRWRFKYANTKARLGRCATGLICAPRHGQSGALTLEDAGGPLVNCERGCVQVGVYSGHSSSSGLRSGYDYFVSTSAHRAFIIEVMSPSTTVSPTTATTQNQYTESSNFVKWMNECVKICMQMLENMFKYRGT